VILVGCAGSKRDVAQNTLCIEDPPNKRVGVAIIDEPFVCIPSLPNNNNAICGPLEARLRERASAAAARTCVNVQNVKCNKRDCPNECLPTATITDAALVLDKNFQDTPTRPMKMPAGCYQLLRTVIVPAKKLAVKLVFCLADFYHSDCT
jgi:hypothetical protein